MNDWEVTKEGSMCRFEITLERRGEGKVDVSHEGFLLHWGKVEKKKSNENLLVSFDGTFAKWGFADDEEKQINENSNNVLEGLVLFSLLSNPPQPRFSLSLVCLFFIRFSQKTRVFPFFAFHFK